MNECLEELLGVFQKHKLNVGEIIIVVGNLLYALGASIGGYKGQGPTVQELEKMYYTDPRLHTAMMIQGIQMLEWYDDLEKVPESNQINNNKQEEPKGSN